MIGLTQHERQLLTWLALASGPRKVLHWKHYASLVNKKLVKMQIDGPEPFSSLWGARERLVELTPKGRVLASKMVVSKGADHG